MRILFSDSADGAPHIVEATDIKYVDGVLSLYLDGQSTASYESSWMTKREAQTIMHYLLQEGHINLSEKRFSPARSRQPAPKAEKPQGNLTESWFT